MAAAALNPARSDWAANNLHGCATVPARRRRRGPGDGGADWHATCG